MDLQQHSTICKGCWQNLHLPVVLRGPLAIPFRVVGLRPSRMNPNTCTFCELAFTRIMKARNVTIDATVLFVDLRGYTTASESLASSEMTSTLDTFYDECAEAILRGEKTLFDFADHPDLVNIEDHVAQMGMQWINDPGAENLAQSDKAVLQLRRMFMSRLTDFVAGTPAGESDW